MFLTNMIDPRYDYLINGYKFNKNLYNTRMKSLARHRDKESLKYRIFSLYESKKNIVNQLGNSLSNKQREFRLHLIQRTDRRMKRNIFYLKNYDLVRIRLFMKALSKLNLQFIR